jgi:hypothetical protein
MTETPKEWTLMFYFASDNPLAPSIVSQLKALKNAGFHPEANVVARFDPHTVGTPLHTFDVNLGPKLKASARSEAFAKLEASAKGEDREKLAAVRADCDDLRIYQVGFPPNDPFIRNLVYDKLWGDATITNGDGKKKIRVLIGDKLDADVRRFLRHGLDLNGGDKTESIVEGGAGAMAARGALLRDKIESIVGGKGLVKYDPPNPNAPDSAAASGEVKSEGASRGGAQRIKAAGVPDEVDPKSALNDFLQFCAREYPARHYMLFILGHGLVVGNDTFLFDEHAKKHSLKLRELGEAVEDFNKAAGGKLELIGFHSCSMSSIEVAYELQDRARYMLASQGPEFVGSWPYTQILVRVFNDLIRKEGKDFTEKEIEVLVTKIFDYCFYNSYDFQLAGYSFDLALCDLNRVSDTGSHINDLASELMDALGDKKKGDKGDEFIRGLILLAHWEAQDFWRGTYTDLYDFCLCLYRRCGAAPGYVAKETQDRLDSIRAACVGLMTALLGEGEGKKKDGLILNSGFAGPAYQYSHGFSVFFPWSQPSNDDFWLQEYPKYKFGKQTKWDEFLQRYFDNTMRDSRGEERGHDHPESLVKGGSSGKRRSEGDENFDGHLTATLLEGITAHIFSGDELAQLGKGGGGDAMGKGGGGDAAGKGGGGDASGEDDCGCPPIKNYPSFTRGRRREEEEAGEGKEAYKKPTCIGLPKK